MPQPKSATTTVAPINAYSLLSRKQVMQITGLAVDAGVRKNEGQTNIGAYSSNCV